VSGYQELRDLGVTFRPFDGPPPPEGGRRSPFDASWSSTVELLARELRHLDAKLVVVELGLEERDLRVDGMPRANARMTTDAVRISFESKWGPLRYETGEFTRGWYGSGQDGWQANVRAIALGLEALRKVDRYGISKRGDQYTGWKQLPMRAGDESLATAAHAREFLARWDGDITRALKETHPDRGGDEAEFRKVMRARELVT
jgi:hypothetical protein